MGIRVRIFFPVFVVGALTLSSCATPAGQRPGGGQTGGPPGGAPTSERLTIAIGSEIDNLASKLSGTVFAGDFNFMTNSPLTIQDPSGAVHPHLAGELPSRDNGTWVVNADGTMTTTWKVKPNAKWHDGQPVTSRDFAFALQVTLDEAIPVDNRRPEQFMTRIEPRDDKTFVIHWKELYPWANALGADELEPLPAHIMAPAYQAGPTEAFLGHPFWTTPAYVGSGPYRLVQWDRGTQLVYRAFDDFFLGKPAIDEVTFRIIPDTNTVVANVLAGEMDVSVNITLGSQGGATVRNQWRQSGGGTVVYQPTRFRYTQIQFNPEFLEQPALLDVRVRRALMHGIDRATLADIVTAGGGKPTDVFFSPMDALYQRAAQAVPIYEYDSTRALALLREAGWFQTASGALVNASGEPFTLNLRTTEGTDNETEQNILAADLSKLGMQIEQTVIAKSRIRDAEYRVKFPGLNTTAFGIEVPETLRFGLSDQCPDPNRRWTGGNRGCWTSAEFDRLYHIASTSLDPAERADAMIQASKIAV